jgi:NADH pyrophosphatase NudC (nudix superfamily)
MELGALFLILALALLVGMYLSRPFFSLESEHNAPEGEPAEQHEGQLLAERDRLLSALQELDFDHYLGKIPEEDYPPQRAALAHDTAEVLRRLDELPPLEEAREVPAVAAAPAAPVAVEPPDEKLELLISSHRRSRLEKSIGFCPRCGKPVKKSDKFCSRCGMPITL